MVAKKKNEIYPLTIEGYSSDGTGVARLEGQVVFVHGALKGERCQVQLLKVGKSVAWGRVVQVLEPAPARQAPDCPQFPRCGGCQLRHMDYAEELEAKRQRVEDALQRIGGVHLPVPPVLAAPQLLHYRNKVQFPVSPQGIGFYRARSHQVIDVDSCLLQPPGADRLRGALRAWMARYGVSAYDEGTHQGLIRHLYVRFNRAGQALCCVVANARRLPQEEALAAALCQAEPQLVGVVLSVNRDKTNVILGEEFRTLWGSDTLDDTLCGLTFRLSVPSFYQVNRDQAEVLYGKALEFAALTGRETVLDLYCGIGTITLAMAGRAGRVIGAEVVPQAVEDARANAARNQIFNAEFLCADAGQAAQALAQQGIQPDVICVDPPRKGLSPDVIQAVGQMAPQRLVYVSCDPGTLARDLKLLSAQGYQAQEVAAVDLFPRTVHVECAVLLTPKAPSSQN
jgi:23S rRNA (uracil1939-C5)-methyltransferase